MLIELLSNLTDDEWNRQTIAKLWKVKDVASHLLDGNLRGLSISRDGYFGDIPQNINNHQDLVDYLNQLNLSWTHATKRLSPKLLLQLLETTGNAYFEHLKTLNPYENAIFSVAWSGQDISPNWFHIAREYTEKFLHQQQIRDALDKQDLFTKELFYPFIDTLMRAFPFTYKKIMADTGTQVSIKVTSNIGGQWCIKKTSEHWILSKDENNHPDAELIIDPDTAWKLFSKSWRSEDVLDKVQINGDQNLGIHALNIVSFMA